MALKCGDTIFVRDMNGANALRFVAQCEGRFMMISHTPLDLRNGWLLARWQMVLHELIARTIPAKMMDRALTVESTANGRYVNFSLTYPLSITSLADAFGVEGADVRAVLDDLAVSAD